MSVPPKARIRPERKVSRAPLWSPTANFPDTFLETAVWMPEAVREKAMA